MLTYLRAQHRARLQLLQAGDHPAPDRPAHAASTASSDLPAYLDFLRTHPGEAGALLQDLLISVTNFFRDRDAFDALRGAACRRCSPARASATRCASGCRRARPARRRTRSRCCCASTRAGSMRRRALQVFATDLDEDAIRAAREGLYPPAIAADVSEERLRRFFITRARAATGSAASCARRSLFATHDLLKDAPFSRLDLVTCRNLLIYLNRDAQQRALEIVHFALRAARPALPRRLRDRRRRPSTCSAPSTRSTGSSSRGRRATAALPPLAADGALVRSLALHGEPRQVGVATAAGFGSLATPRSLPTPAERGSARRRLVARAAPEADRALRAGLGRRHEPSTRSSTSPSAPAAICTSSAGEPTTQPAARRRSAADRRPAHGAAARARAAKRASRRRAIAFAAGRRRRRVGRSFASAAPTTSRPGSCSSPSSRCASGAAAAARSSTPEDDAYVRTPAAAGRRAEVAPARRHRAGRASPRRS